MLLSDQLHISNDPPLIFHVVGAAAIGADFLPDSVKAAATAGTGYRSNGKSWRLQDGYIGAYLKVNTIPCFMYFSIKLAVIDPPGAQGEMQNIALHPGFFQAGGIGVGHFQNIGKTRVSFRSMIAGQILWILRKYSHFDQRYQLAFEFVEGKIGVKLLHAVFDFCL